MNHSHASSVSVMQRAKPNVNHLFRSKVYVNNFFIKYTSAHNKLMSTYFPSFLYTHGIYFPYKNMKTIV